MDYMFSALDMACLSLILETDLPEVVSDPFGRPSKRTNSRVEESRHEFIARQQSIGLLNVYRDQVVLHEDLSVALAPWREGILAIKHRNPSLTRSVEYDKILYLSETRGVSIFRSKKGLCHIAWYPSTESCFQDFCETFGLSGIGQYNSEPFKLCEEASVMDELIGASGKPKNQLVAEFARDHAVETHRLQAIISSLMRGKGDVVLDVGRNSLLGDAAMRIKLVLKEQHMMKMIFTPNGDMISLESFSREGLWDQIVNFEGK